MSQSERYKFQERGEPFTGIRSVTVTRDDSDTSVRINIREGMWAVDVKDRETYASLPEPAQKAADKLGESATNAIYEGAKEAYWDWAQDAAQEHGFSRVYSAGRSGGWMAVDGTQGWDPSELLLPTDELRAERDAFLALAFEAVEMMAHYRNEFIDNLGAAAIAPQHLPHSSEPIRVLAVLWDDEDGPNCDLYRNKPVLLAQLGTHYEGVVNDALNNPGRGFNADGVTGTVRYLTVKDA